LQKTDRALHFAALFKRTPFVLICTELCINHTLTRTLNPLLRCASVCCSVLQCLAVCCSVLQCAAVACCVLQYVAVRCSVLQCVTKCPHTVTHCNTLQRTALCVTKCPHTNPQCRHFQITIGSCIFRHF